MNFSPSAQFTSAGELRQWEEGVGGNSPRERAALGGEPVDVSAAGAGLFHIQQWAVSGRPAVHYGGSCGSNREQQLQREQRHLQHRRGGEDAAPLPDV